MHYFCAILNSLLTYMYTGNKSNNKNGYPTWDPRKLNGGQGDGGAHGVQYDEIPYGDVGPGGPGHSGKGNLPEVPVEYSQVPQIPQRQGTLRNFLRRTNIDPPTYICLLKI